MGASAGDVEDDLSVDEGRRIIGDVPGPSDLEMGLADGGDDPTTVEDGEGKDSGRGRYVVVVLQ